MKTFFLSLCLLFITAVTDNANAKLEGRPYIDSLIKQLPFVKDNLEKANVLDEISYSYKTIDPAEGIKYAQLEMDISIQMGNKKVAANAFRKLGLNYESMSDYPKALDNYYKSLDLFEELHQGDLAAEVISNIAGIYSAQGNYAKALEYDLKCLAIDEKANLQGNIAGDEGNIGNVYMSLANYPEALKHDLRSLKLFRDLGDKNGIANNLGNIGNIYEAQRKYEDALENNFQALAAFQELDDNQGLANTNGNIGSIYVLIAGDSTAEVPQGRYILAGKKANLLKGIEYLTKGIAISKKIGQLDDIIQYSRYRSFADSLAGNYKAALDDYEQYAATKDSVFSSSNKVQIANIEANGALELKYKQIQIDRLEEAKKNREKILLFIGVAILVIAVVLVFEKFNNQANANKLLAKEKKQHLQHIREQTDVLTDIAYKQSHEVRAPIATILGLVQLFNFDDPADPINKEVIEGVAEVTESLDIVVQEVIRIENSVNVKSAGI